MTYVSISGITKERDMYQLEAFAEAKGISRDLFFGIQATEKTLLHRRSNSRGTGWHPVGDAIYDSFYDREMSAYTFGRYKRVGRRILHFSYERDNNDAEAYFTTRTILDRWPPGVTIDGWQFNNLSWHLKDFTATVDFVRNRLHECPLIGQLNTHALEGMSQTMFERLVDSGLSHVLLDSSGGLGHGFDYESYRRYVDMIKSSTNQLEIAIAGGIASDTEAMENFMKLQEEFGPLSCDAEGRLRDYPAPEDPEYLAKSSLSLKKCREYLICLC